MATSPVYISNLALGMLGNASRIQSMTDMSPQAKAANLWYSIAIDFTLSQRDWSFARRQAPLALHADDPPQQWAYFYQTPADLLVARYLAAPPYYTGHKIPFELLASADGETVGLATNLEDAELIYTRRVSQPAVFTLAGTLPLLGAAERVLTARLPQPIDPLDEFALCRSDIELSISQIGRNDISRPPGR